MKRTIKFRGLRADGDGWAYGFPYSSMYDEDVDQIVEWDCHHDVDPETVGQFTGLYDKNGTEIYEGDILTSDLYPFKDEGERNYDAIVTWVFSGFQYILTCVNREKRGISEGINETLEDGVYFEIIGNIHKTE